MNSQDALPPAKGVLRFLRARRKEKRARGEISDRLYYLYCAALILGFAVLQLSSFFEGASRAVGGPDRLLAWVERLGPPALLVAFFAGLRYATWQGPAVFSRPDVTFLLAAPIPRDQLVRSKLPWGLAGGALLGVAVGLVGFVGAKSVLSIGTLPLLAACVLPFGSLGLLTASLGWQVERSAALSRALLRASPPILLTVLALSFAPTFAPGWGVDVTLLSGPWGWALVPVLAAAGEPAPPWPLAASLLGAATALVVAWALATAGKVPVEELSRRADLRRGLYVSLYVTDFRGAALLRQQASHRFAGLPPKTRLPRPRHALLAVPWRDAVWALRNKGRVAWAAFFSGGATLAALVAPSSIFVVFGALLLAYLGTAWLVETMRAEVDAPGASLVLPYRYGDLVLLHALLPTLLLTTIAALSCVAGFFLGVLPGIALPAALALCLPAAAALTACAAFAAQRSRILPLEVMQAAFAMGDIGALAILQWYAAGPIRALLALGVPALLLALASGGPSPPWGAVLGAGAYLLLFAAVSARRLKKRRPPA